jgi:hypothetical protein
LVWSARPVLEAKNTSWKGEIMALVLKVLTGTFFLTLQHLLFNCFVSQAVETGVAPNVVIPTGEEYKTLSKE